jgi:hypothetical protein
MKVRRRAGDASLGKMTRWKLIATFHASAADGGLLRLEFPSY